MTKRRGSFSHHAHFALNLTARPYAHALFVRSGSNHAPPPPPPSPIALMENGLLDRRESFDLLDNLDFGIMELGMSDEEPSNHSGAESASVEPVPDGPDEDKAQAGSSKPTVPPPPLPTTESAATDKAAVTTGVKTRAFRNSGAGEEGGAVPASSVGGGEKVSTQEGGDGVQGGGVPVRSIGGGGGPAGGGNGTQDSEHEVDVRINRFCYWLGWAL